MNFSVVLEVVIIHEPSYVQINSYEEMQLSKAPYDSFM